MFALVVIVAVPVVDGLRPASGTYWRRRLRFSRLCRGSLIAGDAAPALLVLAVRGPLVFFLLPPFVLRPLARLRPLRAVLSFLLRPGVSFGIWVLAFGAWHMPAAFDSTLRHPIVHDLEHASFVLAGLLVWTQLIDPARHARLRVGQRAAYAVALFLAGQVLSEVLIFSSPLYPAYAGQPNRLLGLSPATDQVRAGLLMMAEQVVTLGSCAALLLWAHVESLGVSYAGEHPARAPEGAELARADDPVATLRERPRAEAR